MKAFRRLDSLSGELRVVGGSRKRRGVRRQGRRASCNSPKGKAGFDASGKATAGGSARTSAARAAGRKTGAKPAKPKAHPAGRPSDKKAVENHRTRGKGGGNGPIESLWDERAQLDGGVPLPEDGVGFVDAVNVNIDLIRLTELLLRGTDERSSKSLLERLLEMRYGKIARAALAETGPLTDASARSARDRGEEP